MSKTYTIICTTKANRTEYLHAVTVEAANVTEAKQTAAAVIRDTLNRHAFRIANATAPASVKCVQRLADLFGTTADAVMQAASRPEGVDIYADEFKPVEAENPITPGNAPLYVWTFANGAESAATLAAEASSAADATEYARAARICANEATEAAEIAGTAEAAKDAERARIAADRAEQASQRAEYVEPEPAPTEATKNAARWADLAEQAAQDVETAATTCDADACDNRAQMYAAAAADEATRYDADQTTEQHTARAARAAEQARAALTARVQAGITYKDIEAAASSDYAKCLTLEAIEKAGADAEEIAAEAMTETNEAMSEASEAERKTIEAAICYDHEAAAEYAKQAEEAAQRAEIAAKKAACMDPTTADTVSEEAAFARAYADRATETAEQNAAEIEERARIIDQIEDPQHREYIRATAEAHQLTPDETRENIAYYATNRAANRAAISLLEAYAEAIGEHPTEDDDETRAAYRVARDEITGTSQRATEYDRETVDLITEAIARSARRPDLSKYESMPYLEIEPAPVYQPAELLAYLGEPDDYDVEAIEAEATAYDTATGRRIWVAFGDDLAAIAERHQIATYYPAAF